MELEINRNFVLSTIVRRYVINYNNYIVVNSIVQNISGFYEHVTFTMTEIINFFLDIYLKQHTIAFHK